MISLSWKVVVVVLYKFNVLKIKTKYKNNSALVLVLFLFPHLIKCSERVVSSVHTQKELDFSTREMEKGHRVFIIHRYIYTYK